MALSITATLISGQLYDLVAAGETGTVSWSVVAPSGGTYSLSALTGNAVSVNFTSTGEFEVIAQDSIDRRSIGLRIAAQIGEGHCASGPGQAAVVDSNDCCVELSISPDEQRLIINQQGEITEFAPTAGTTVMGDGFSGAGTLASPYELALTKCDNTPFQPLVDKVVTCPVWPAFANYAALPVPGTVDEDYRAFNTETLGHYRYAAAERYPVDAERGRFNTRDYLNIQACIDAAVDYSQNSPAAVAYGWQVPAIVEVDEAILAETMLIAVNVTIPGNAQIVFRGKDGWYGYISLNITITGGVSDFNYIAFDSVINYGTITAPGSLELYITDGGQFGNITVSGRFYVTSHNGYNGGEWNSPQHGAIRLIGGFFYPTTGAGISGTVLPGLNLQVKDMVLGGNIHTVPFINLSDTQQARIHLTGITMNIGQLIKTAGTLAEDIYINDCRITDQGNGGSIVPFIEIGSARNLAIQNCSMGAAPWPQSGFADIANANNLIITNNQVTPGAPLAGSTAPIRIGSATKAVISGNTGNAFAHVVDMPAATAANTTMIGNRFNFTTAVATNAPAINLGNI